MKCNNLSELIKNLRTKPKIREFHTNIVFPYTELYGRYKSFIPTGLTDLPSPKQELMSKIRIKYQSLTNPHQHSSTLKKIDFQSCIPDIKKEFTRTLRKKKMYNVERYPRKNYSMSVPPQKKKNLLFYRIESKSPEDFSKKIIMKNT